MRLAARLAACPRSLYRGAGPVPEAMSGGGVAGGLAMLSSVETPGRGRPGDGCHNRIARLSRGQVAPRG